MFDDFEYADYQDHMAFLNWDHAAHVYAGRWAFDEAFIGPENPFDIPF